jgi:hypothetical protein
MWQQMDDSNPMAWDPFGGIGGNQSFQVDNQIQTKKPFLLLPPPFLSLTFSIASRPFFLKNIAGRQYKNMVVLVYMAYICLLIWPGQQKSKRLFFSGKITILLYIKLAEQNFISKL